MHASSALPSSAPPSPRFHVPRLVIIGVGLIGGSLAMNLRRQQLVGHVIGVGRSRANLELALRNGVIDQIVDDAAHAAAQADVILLATPVNAMTELFQSIQPVLDHNTVVTDVGSVKGGVCEAATAILGEKIARFVPGHPVAGKEHSGVQSATADLFHNHNVVLTPLPSTDAKALKLVTQMWRATGATVSTMAAEQHDRVLSLTSHLPHVLAYAMVDLFANFEELVLAYDMAAGGFYDFSRTASSDSEMWRDICLMNRAQIVRHIEQFQERLQRIKGMLKENDAVALERLFAAAKVARSQVIEKRTQNT